MKVPVEQTSRWEAAKSSCKVCVRASQTLLNYTLCMTFQIRDVYYYWITDWPLWLFWLSFTDFTDLGRFKALFVELPGFFSFSLMLSKQEPLKLQHVADLHLQALFGTVSQFCLVPRRLSLSMKIWAQREAGKRKRARRHLASHFCPSHGPLRFVTSDSHVIRVSQSPLCKKRSAWGGGW